MGHVGPSPGFAMLSPWGLQPSHLQRADDGPSSTIIFSDPHLLPAL